MQLSGVNLQTEQPLLEHPHKVAELGRMKFIATSLLVAAFIIFVAASVFEGRAVWIGFVRATAEAAMVGALADWFAVTALFRHPLGLKIPHTAIVPNRKEEIGRQLGLFIKDNFLSRDVISERLQTLEITKRVAVWLSRPQNSQLIAKHLAEGLAAAVQVMKDEDVQALIERSMAAQIRTMRFAPLLGNLLSLVLSGNRKQELLSMSVKTGGQFIRENKIIIKQKINQETPWWLPRNIDNKIYQKIVDAVDDTLQEVNANPDHPLHKNFSFTIDRFVEDLKNSPEMLAREAALKEELLQQPVVREFSSSLWTDIKASLMSHASEANANIRHSIQEGLVRFGQTAQHDQSLLEKIDHWVEEVLLYLIEKYGHEVEYLIAHTINKWDGQDAARKIEVQVGKDLQFIRINGTLVGGLVGFAIHAIYLLIG